MDCRDKGRDKVRRHDRDRTGKALVTKRLTSPAYNFILISCLSFSSSCLIVAEYWTRVTYSLRHFILLADRKKKDVI